MAGRLRTVFLGTPAFAVPTLEALLAAGHEVPLVVTQPDKPQGRKRELIPSPVKACALKHDIEVFQPERIRRPEAFERLAAVGAEIMVVVGYGQIIPQALIDLPPRGIVNVHASLLPELRGAAPIQWAIVRGHAVTGVTTMQINAGLDTGDILQKWETPIDENETAPELSERLARAGAGLLIQTVADLESGKVLPEQQDSAKATFAPIIKKEDGRIDWNDSARQVHNLVRGLQPWPGAYTSFRGQSLHVWRSRLTSERLGSPPGTLVYHRGLFASCGDGAALELLEVQLEGRKRMPADIFANGHRLKTETTQLAD